MSPTRGRHHRDLRVPQRHRGVHDHECAAHAAPPGRDPATEPAGSGADGLQQIHSMALRCVDDGGDEFIIAGANTVGGVAVFQRVDGGRILTLVARSTCRTGRAFCLSNPDPRNEKA
ncbi:hypothetical protein DFH06DRAFT_565808 [Mycena polygramma]|nr:hypothetical protein DFH06DRAFT_565808 [Mycena polygramma]